MDFYAIQKAVALGIKLYLKTEINQDTRSRLIKNNDENRALTRNVLTNVAETERVSK